MNKKNIIIGAMIAVFLISLLKITIIPGRGILTTLITISAALLFYIVPMRKVILNLFSDKRKAETQGPAYANVLEAFYATFMPIFTIGILFKLLHWPGANIMLSIGFITILICACLVLFIYKASNCVYFSSARAIAIATILYALLFGTQYYYHFLETIRWEGSDVLEYYNKALELKPNNAEALAKKKNAEDMILYAEQQRKEQERLAAAEAEKQPGSGNAKTPAGH